MSSLRRIVLLCALVAIGAVGTAAATTLRISLPPVLEALPIAFAESWGMFDEAGIDVEVVGITDNQERSTALLTGNLDAVMSDVTSAVLDYGTNQSVVVVAAAGSTPQPGALRLALLSHVGFGPSDVAGLLECNQLVGVTYRTDDEYLLDQFFAANGLQPRVDHPLHVLQRHAAARGVVWREDATRIHPARALLLVHRHDPPRERRPGESCRPLGLLGLRRASARRAVPRRLRGAAPRGCRSLPRGLRRGGRPA